MGRDRASGVTRMPLSEGHHGGILWELGLLLVLICEGD